MKRILGLLFIFMVLVAGISFALRKATDTQETDTTRTETVKRETNDKEKTDDTETVETVVTHGNYAPIEVDDSDFVSTWNIEYTDGYSDYMDAYYDHTDIGISSSGTSSESVRYFVSGFTIYGGTDYTLTFTASSSISRNITVKILNGDDLSVITSSNFYLTADDNTYTLSFKTAGNVWNGRIQFDLGSADALEYHTISLSNIFVDTSNSNTLAKVNQIGYMNTNQKRFTVSGNQGDMFKVIDVDTNEVVYTGSIKHYVNDPNTKEYNGSGDFTNVMDNGNYMIKTQLGGMSSTFSIGENLYDEVFDDVFRFFSLQRCGSWLDPALFGNLAHDACHTSEAIVYDQENVYQDATGGWHDAGDYGRYVETGVKAINDLLFAYMADPDDFDDDMGIMESGNGQSDLLDEVKVELDWLIKMVTDWGEVYSKEVTKSFAGDVSPVDDTGELYLLNGETTTTGDAAGALALASVLYKDYDGDFAQKCLEKAELCWAFLENNPDLKVSTNPDDFSAGLYRDTQDSDERFYAASCLYMATKDKTYLDYAEKLFKQNQGCANGINYTNVGTFGKYLLINVLDEGNFRKQLIESLEQEADAILYLVDESGFNTALDSYSWGSNGDICNNGIILMMAFEYTDNEAYRQSAIEQLNYIFGKNSLNMTFVTGQGTNSPLHPHSRMSYASNTLIEGALVGGANANREDGQTQQLGDYVAAAKVYVDAYTSYSTNEVSIYWNSALLHLMARIYID